MPDKDERTPEEECKLWQQRIKLAQEYQKKHGDTDGRWTDNVKALAGDFGSAATIGADAIDVNMVRSSVKTALPPLWVNEPHISVRATTPEYKGQDNVRRAEYTEAEIAYWLRELGVKNVVRKILLDAECTNLGYAYVGYTKNKADVEIDGERTENDPVIQHKKPFVRRMPPRHVLLPPGYSELEDHPWVGLYFLERLEDVKKRYPAVADKIEATKCITDDSVVDAGSMRDYLDSDDARLVEVVKIWNKRDHKVYTIAIDHPEYLEDPAKWPFETEGFPLVLYRPEEVPDEYHASPPISFYLPQNIELNVTRTAMKRRRSKTKSVIFMDADMSKEVGEKYAKAKDGEIIPVELGGEPIQSKMVVDTGLPFDTGDLGYDAVIKDDIRNETGLGSEQRGAGDPNVDSATASANIEKHAQIRSSDRGDKVRDLYLGIAKKLWMIVKQFPDEERTRLIAGATAGSFSVLKYTTKELEGEFAFDMDVSAMLSDNPATRQTQAIVNYNLFRADPLVNPERLIIDVFKSQNKPDPAAYMLFLRSPDEEHQMMLSALPVEAHERDEHEAHIKQHDATADAWDKAVSRIPQQAPENMKLRIAVVLAGVHIQDHVRKLQQIAGATGKQPGQPVAENMLRNQVKVSKGGETAAEMSGQPLTPEGNVQ